MARIVMKPFRVDSVDNTSQVANVQNGEMFIDNTDGSVYFKNTSGVLKRGVIDIAKAYPNKKPVTLLDFQNTRAMDSRIAFSRSTPAYIHDGSMALAEQNLLPNSADMANTWVKTGVSITAAVGTLPVDVPEIFKLVGTSPADYNGQTDMHAYAGINATGGKYYGVSVYLKSAELSFANVILHEVGGGRKGGVIVNLTNGSVVQQYFVSSGSTVGVDNMGDGWYRVKIVYLMEQTRALRLIVIGNDMADPSTAVWGDMGWPVQTGGGVNGILFGGAQIEERNAVTAYTRTTGFPVTTMIPALVKVPAQVPRFEVDPVTRESLGYYGEGGNRTNYVLHSNTPHNWGASRVKRFSNYAIAPNGKPEAMWVAANEDNSGNHFVSMPCRALRPYTFGADPKTYGYYVFSVYAKNVSGQRFLQLALAGNETGVASYTQFAHATFDLDSLTVTRGGMPNDGSGPIAAFIHDVGNGWRRLVVVANFVRSTTEWSQGNIYLLESSGSTAGTGNFVGDSRKGVLVWGAQIELGTSASSLIETNGAEVTYGNDAFWLYEGANGVTWPEREFAVMIDYTPKPYMRADTNEGEVWLGYRVRVDCDHDGKSDVYLSYAGNVASYDPYLHGRSAPSNWWRGSDNIVTVSVTDAKCSYAYNGDDDWGGPITPTVPVKRNYNAIGGSRWNGHIRKIAVFNGGLSNDESVSVTT